MKKDATTHYMLWHPIILYQIAICDSKSKLADSLSQHCICYFLKSGNVSTYYVVALVSVSLSSIYHVVADIYHDSLKLSIYFFECPAQTLAVLRHFQCRCCDTAAILYIQFLSNCLQLVAVMGPTGLEPVTLCL